MKLISLAASCATLMCSAHGDDVTIDWDKITNSQTDFSINAKNLLQPAPIKSAKLSGHMQLDLFGKRLKMVVSGSMLSGAPGGFNPNIPLFSNRIEKDGKSEIVVDGVTGNIGIRALGSASIGPISAEGNYCLVAKAPPQMLNLPPAAVMKMQLHPVGEKAQQMANAFPHTVEGDIVTYKAPPGPPEYPHPAGEIQIHTDGVPIKLETHTECGEQCNWGGLPHTSIDVSFANWQEGAGEIVPISCSEGSTMDISAYPHAMHAMTAYDLVTQQLLDHPLTKEFATLLPSTVPLMKEQIRLASMQQKDTNIWPSAVVSLVAGMSGGAVVLALVAAFARKAPMSEPLLSEA